MSNSVWILIAFLLFKLVINVFLPAIYCNTGSKPTNPMLKHNKTGLQPFPMACGTGSLFLSVGRGCKVPLVPRPCRQTKIQDWQCQVHKSGHKSVQNLTDRQIEGNTNIKFAHFGEQNLSFRGKTQ